MQVDTGQFAALTEQVEALLGAVAGMKAALPGRLVTATAEFFAAEGYQPEDVRLIAGNRAGTAQVAAAMRRLQVPAPPRRLRHLRLVGDGEER